jgi:hypothetical protein
MNVVSDHERRIHSKPLMSSALTWHQARPIPVCEAISFRYLALRFADFSKFRWCVPDAGWRAGCFLFEGEVHALVAAVLLGMSGLDAFNPQKGGYASHRVPFLTGANRDFPKRRRRALQGRSRFTERRLLRGSELANLRLVLMRKRELNRVDVLQRRMAIGRRAR